MKIETMDDLFLEQIEDLYDAEKRLVKALPKMAEASNSAQLRQAFEMHLEQTKGQVERLNRIFGELGKKAKGETCEAMKGLIEEGEKAIDDIEEPNVRDAGLIAAANRVEHYEIAGYGSAKAFAQMLGLTQAATLLEETLEEEKQADQKLTRLAQTLVNQNASRGTRETQKTR
ncbi:MAG TPA: ferritin-like domain-containing protein [Bryobacteraceae bacterium]|nr:ferritin-like domain-containing protein [Bryobacteraceae bacterium]